MIVNLVLEGLLEEPVARKIVEYCGHSVGTVHGRRGFGYVLKEAYKFHNMVKCGMAVFVLTDFMDAKCACVVQARHQYLTKHIPQPSNKFVLRFAVAELESWLLADRLQIAKFLGVPTTRIPHAPDQEADPKQTLVNIARRSRVSNIKHSIVPDEKHGGTTAPGYMGVMQSFVVETWDVEAAQLASPSLQRCVSNLNRL